MLKANAIVLCAGFGTRLRPLTDALPKPLVPVGDRPLVDHILERLFKEPSLKVVVNAHHAVGELLSYFKEKWPEVRVSSEEKILGTAGGVRRAFSADANSDVLVINGDIDGDLPLKELLAESESSTAMLLAVVPRALGEGTVGFDASGAVVRLRGEVFGVEAASGDYMGVMRLSKSVLGELPEEGCLIGDVALPRLRQGLRDVRVLPTNSAFIDIGSLATYFQANMEWLTRRGDSAFVAAGAQVEPSVTLLRSVLMAGSRATGHGALHEVVALPGSLVTAPLERTIVLPDGRLIPIAAS